MHILFICTANQCRSPMAETIARSAIDTRGGSAQCRSRGTAPGGSPATERAQAEMKRRGLDLEHHQSATVEAEDLAWATLVLTMERSHLHRVAAVDAMAVARSFTLREAAALTVAMGRRLPTEEDDQAVARLHRHRLPGSILTFDTNDDVPDPTGRGRRAHRRIADEIERLVERVLDSLMPNG